MSPFQCDVATFNFDTTSLQALLLKLWKRSMYKWLKAFPAKPPNFVATTAKNHETKLLPGGYGKKIYKNYLFYLTVISLGLTEILQNVQS